MNTFYISSFFPLILTVVILNHRGPVWPAIICHYIGLDGQCIQCATNNLLNKGIHCGVIMREKHVVM